MADLNRHVVKASCSVCHGIVYADQGYHDNKPHGYDISVPSKEES